MPRRRETYQFMGAELIGGGTRVVVQPVLPIILWGPDGSKGVGVRAALVDTGADYCTCPSKLTKPIGYKLRSGTPVQFQGAAATGKAWQHSMDISIMTHDCRGTFHRLSGVPCHVVQKRNPFPILLGRDGFLDKFVVHIDFINQLFTLEIA